jgi:nitrite reductase/ring-hydroxylating ferredoxin subunit
MSVSVEKEDPCGAACACGVRGGLSRRRLLELVLGLGAGLLLLPARAWAKKLAVKLDSLPALKKVGGFAIAKLKDREMLFVRDSAKTVKAFGSLCSHQKYRLAYDPRSKQIICANHGSRFDLAGKPLKGPATAPLAPIYAAELDEGKGRIVVKVS